MNIAVVISTLNRPEILQDTILSVLRQTCVPSQILLSSPGPQHILPQTMALPGVMFVQSAVGSCAQRNAALDLVDPKTDLVAFLDDDIELCKYYLEEMIRLFSSRPDIIVSSGTMLHDGGRGASISREQARVLCAERDRGFDSGVIEFVSLDFGYGCNLICRYSRAKDFRFDERLPLYGWMEDSDFSYRCTRGLRGPVSNLRAFAIHLGWRSGRVSGLKLGFSTIVNPVYLKRKGNMFPFRHIIINLWARCLIGNIIGLITRDREYDRAGLLRGNLIAFRHLLSGRCEPEYVLHLQ